MPNRLIGVKAPSPTKVELLATMMPAFLRPMNAINMPIPTEIANLMFLGILSIISSRTLKNVMRMNTIPSMSMMASACSHV